MKMVNRICPRCNNPNYVVSLDGFSKAFPYKCLNCNSYLTEEDFITGKVKQDKFDENNGWISVKDRLPEKNQIVIASDGEHTWDVGMYKSFCGKPSEWNWKKNTVKTVLWWMPKDGALPKPPKEEN